MGIELTLDEKLVDEAKRQTGLSDGSAAVETLLRQRLAGGGGQKKRKGLFELAGKIEFYEGFDHKTLRKDRDFSD